MNAKLFLETDKHITDRSALARAVAKKYKFNYYAVHLTQAFFKLVANEILSQKAKKQKGFTLLEVLVALTLSSIALWGLGTALSLNLKITKRSNDRLQDSITQAQALIIQLQAYAASNPATAVYLDSTCKAVNGVYFGKKENATTAKLYINSTCTSYAGSLNTTDNSTFFNDPTNSLWVVSASGTGLRIVVISFDIFGGP